MTHLDFWQSFLRETHRPAGLPMPEAWHFDLNERDANALLRLVLRDVKHATASSQWSFELEGEPLPEEGTLSIITDWDGEPWCVIETTRVHTLPYRDVTFELASLEGEDDDLDSWRRHHEAFFREDGNELGYTFTEDMPVVLEEFRVIYRREGDA